MEQHISTAIAKMERPAVVKSTIGPAQAIETAFTRALSGKKVFAFSENELKPVMLYIYALVGLRGENYPKGLDKDFIHAYIRENYGGHSAEEIRLAFTMAIQGRLDIDAKDVKCYEHFNVAYFSSIMEAYREWAREEIKKVPEKKDQNNAEKWVIDLEYAYYKINLIDKLPCQILTKPGFKVSTNWR